ncbi:MAG: apolipoprotein N-acyltransferase [Ketobacteraceae bacterium]|nr:apolipoprotein N-acyltransferase [Ketobacteraceae bacterium]
MKITTAWTSGYRGNLLALVAGCLFPLGFAPIHLWPLTILSMALLVPLLEGQTAKRSFVRGWLYGFGFYSVGVSWVYISIHTYGYTPQWLSVILTGLFAAGLALFFALFAWSYQRLALGRWYWLGFPSLWILFEWIKSWLLSGFPWLYAGNAFIDTPLAGLAPVTGVLGMSWVAALSAALLVYFAQRPAKRYQTVAVILVLWGLGYGLQTRTWVTPSLQDSLDIAIVQGNIPQEKKWDPSERENILATYARHSEANWDKDVVIWPEAALPVFYQEARDFMGRMQLQASDTDTGLITGTPFWKATETEYQYFNSIVSLGNGSGVYHKQRLVPFGEYVPLEAAIRGLIPFFDLPMSSFTPGSDDQQPLMAGGASFAPFICYEIVYPEQVRELGSDADYLITISNDAWFGRSWGPHQHFEIARLRALELGKYLVRATNTGITAIIDHRGQVQAAIPRFEEAVLEGTIYTTIGKTPYRLWGWWPMLGFGLLIILVIQVRRRLVKE